MPELIFLDGANDPQERRQTIQLSQAFKHPVEIDREGLIKSEQRERADRTAPGQSRHAGKKGVVNQAIAERALLRERV